MGNARERCSAKTVRGVLVEVNEVSREVGGCQY